MEMRDVYAQRSRPISVLSRIANQYLVVLCVCVVFASQPNIAIGVWPEGQSTPSGPTSPLEHFGKLVSDSWTVTAKTGRKMHHTWKWGPGKQSIERWTDGESAQGTPWKELIVYYWQPNEKRVRFLGISPYASGINHGTIAFDGQSAIADSRLAQTQGIREMQTRWRFENADCYRETLLERDSTGKLNELVSFEHLREPVDANSQTRVPASPAVIRDELSGLGFLLGDSWAGKLDGKSQASLRTSLNWISHANFFLGRVTEEPASNDSKVFANFYVYFDTESKSVRCLIVTSEAQAFEGQIRQAPEGDVQVELKSTSFEEITLITTSFEKTAPNRFRQRMRTTQGSTEAQTLTMHHER
jgi:hypothetical protein